MHDPMTVAFNVRIPLPWKKPNTIYKDKRREWCYIDVATIWHKDPEKDGTDNSCGFGYIKLKKHVRERLRNAAWSEAYSPHFLICREKEWNGTHADAESLYRGLVALVDRVLKLNMKWEEICRYATEAVHVRDGCSKYGGAFCFLPGYHTNWKEDSRDDRQDHFTQILCAVATSVLTDRRPWHIWHWRIQIPFLQLLHRRLFVRCCRCKKGFKWGESVIGSWSGKEIWHDGCDRTEVKP